MDTYLALLAAIAFLAGIINSAFGVGGGVMLIATLPSGVPMNAVVPLHGIAILTNNIVRSLQDSTCIRWHIVLKFLVGSVIGMLLALPLLRLFPKECFPYLLSMGILAAVWTPRFNISKALPLPFFCCGFIQTFLSMFIGATGPLVMLFFLGGGFNRDEIIVHNAILNMVADTFKMIGFILMGFNYLVYWRELLVLVACMTIGAFCGKKARHLIPQRSYDLLIKLLISALALQILIKQLLAG